MVGKTPVLIVLCLPRSVAYSVGQAETYLDAGIVEIDRTLDPIPLAAPSNRFQERLDLNNEQLVLVRGKVDERHVEELRQSNRVASVSIDNIVAPFDFLGSPRPRLQEDFETASELTSFPPIPPCDCNLGNHHAYQRDVSASLGADQVWREGINGDGVVVGIVDGGTTAEGRLDPDTPGLVPGVIGGWPEDSWGKVAKWNRHGNKMVVNVLGMAPGAKALDIRISDDTPSGAWFSRAIAGLDWAINNYRRHGIPQILVCGWGIYQRNADVSYATDPDHPLTRKIVEALDEGILVLFSAGNGGETCPSPLCGEDIGPGKSIWGANGHQRVMTIGAVNKDGQWIGYSSQGPAALSERKPDFCGVSHFSGYNNLDSGTSTACAVAAGIVALLKQARPTLTQESAKRILQSTAKDIGPPGWDRHSGFGIIQAKAAYDRLMESSGLPGQHVALIEQLQAEIRCLKELFAELAIERRMNATKQPTK